MAESHRLWRADEYWESLSNKKHGTNSTTSLSMEWLVGIQEKRHPEIIDTGEKSTRSDTAMEDMPHWHLRDMVHTQICRLKLQSAILISPLMFRFPCSPWVLFEVESKALAEATGQVSSFTSPVIGLWGWKERVAFSHWYPLFWNVAGTLEARQAWVIHIFMVFNMLSLHLSWKFEVWLWYYHDHHR